MIELLYYRCYTSAFDGYFVYIINIYRCEVMIIIFKVAISNIPISFLFHAVKFLKLFSQPYRCEHEYKHKDNWLFINLIDPVVNVGWAVILFCVKLDRTISSSDLIEWIYSSLLNNIGLFYLFIFSVPFASSSMKFCLLYNYPSQVRSSFTNDSCHLLSGL